MPEQTTVQQPAPAPAPAPKPQPPRRPLHQIITTSKIWKSIFRHDFKDTPRTRVMRIFGNVFLHLQPVRIPRSAIRVSYSWGLGGITFFLFLILTVTGVLLMFYYRPSVTGAYQDMKDLEFVVTLGLLLRNMHRWSAHAMVVCTILHMIRVFLTGAYKAPREFNWGVGIVLLVLTLLLSFTGYLLPWDQLALWAVTVGTNMASATPLLGAEGPFSIVTPMNDARFVTLGGTIVGQNTLLRFYVLHCIALPLVLFILVSVHFWRVRKDGFSTPDPKSPAYQDKVDAWPHLIAREFLAALLVLILLTGASIFRNAPLEEAANPNRTPNPSKAPWYFAGLQELLVYFDPWIAGVVLPGVIVVGLLAIPYIDPNPKGVGYYSIKDRPLANSIFLFGNFLWFLLIAIGMYCRGPNWEWYWPWEPWSSHRITMARTWNIPNPIGLALIGGYFALGMTLPALLKRDFLKQLGLIKYSIVMGLLLMMGGVVGKILLRLLLNVKYIVSFPQFNLNI